MGDRETTSTPRRSTTQGAAVMTTLRDQEGFRSAQDVYAELRAAGHKIGLSTVYRHLQTLTESGAADAIHQADGETVYRYCGASSTHHHHLVCRTCGRAVEVEGQAVERWAAATARQHGFIDVDHTLEVFGLCSDCAA